MKIARIYFKERKSFKGKQISRRAEFTKIMMHVEKRKTRGSRRRWESRVAWKLK